MVLNPTRNFEACKGAHLQIQLFKTHVYAWVYSNNEENLLERAIIFHLILQNSVQLSPTQSNSVQLSPVQFNSDEQIMILYVPLVSTQGLGT